MAWQFILTDLQGQVLGELRNADERKVVLPHLRVPTASFKLPLWNERTNDIMTGDTLVRCYRTDPVSGNRKLAFHGPVISAEEVAEGSTSSCSVTAAGPYWRLNHGENGGRFIGRTKAGISWTTQDLGLTAHAILDVINGDYYTGISKGTRTTSISGAYGPVWLKNAAEAIAELGAGLNSFELEIAPTEPTNVYGPNVPQLGVMNIAPIIGQLRPDAIFEFGGGGKSNIASYSRKRDWENLANVGHISVQGWPDAPEQNKDIITRADLVSINERGYHAAIIPDAGVIDDGLRTGIADFHMLYRKNPRLQITFKPVVNARPAPLEDYGVGDTVRARATVRGTLKFDALFRIWGITFNVDKNGNENVELELVQP